MFKRIFALLFLLVLIATIFGVYQVYRDYVNRKTERLARLQQKTESISVTLIEGWTNDQVANQLEKQGLFSKQDFLNALNKFDESQYPLLVRDRKSVV